MHISLDGFTATTKNEMNWIHVDDEIFDYAGDRTNVADTAVYGRVTWEMMDAYWPTAADQPGAGKHEREHSAWYKRVEKIVLSDTLKDAKKDKTRFFGSGDVVENIKALKQQPGGEIVLFGSPGAVHSLMEHQLIDEFWLFVNPILLGDGNPMFKGITEKVKLKLITSKAFSSGVVCLHYERITN